MNMFTLINKHGIGTLREYRRTYGRVWVCYHKEAEICFDISYEKSIFKCVEIINKPVDETEFFDVTGFNGVYKINRQGNVLVTRTNNFLKGSLTLGYRCVLLNKDKKQYCLRVHRILAGLFIPNPNNKPEINHIDGNKANNSLDNLEWATSSENSTHYYADKVSEKALLTEDQIREILRRKKLHDDNTTRNITRDLGIKKYAISNLVNGKTYKNVVRKIMEGK